MGNPLHSPSTPFTTRQWRWSGCLNRSGGVRRLQERQEQTRVVLGFFGDRKGVHVLKCQCAGRT
ncbi:hypothetical protein E2C01_034010 [Portunus trituberculatus]|uniref:Uncharacterized protein n=1 Tax=Portunus trituberculatus TaxID=210409 RepID=A0A5B7F5S6_PORTR|nr:hypothetical protein [Portunus trituberculatus]